MNINLEISLGLFFVNIAALASVFLIPSDSVVRQMNKAMKTVGAPVKLLHESVGFTCTVELKSGEVYRGLVVDVEDNWNIQLQAVAYTSREGIKSQLDHVYLRGSQVRFIILPDMLRNSPIFTRFTPQDRARNPIINTEAPKMFKKPRTQ